MDDSMIMCDESLSAGKEAKSNDEEIKSILTNFIEKI